MKKRLNSCPFTILSEADEANAESVLTGATAGIVQHLYACSLFAFVSCVSGCDAAQRSLACVASVVVGSALICEIGRT